MSNAAKEAHKPTDNRDLVKINDVVKGKWTVQRKIGGGGFGEIYEVQDVRSSARYAMKVESIAKEKQVLKMDVAVLRKLRDCQFACQFIGAGRCPGFNYVVMTLQGPSLSELRRQQANVTFSVNTALRLGKQMMSALQYLHQVGFLHRDVKPSNFAMGSTASTKHTCYMLDFGLSRQYVDSDGCIRPPRPNAGFRGTVRYASLNAHNMKEMGRHDDLWSLFYVIAEFLMGNLPWRKIKDKDVVGEIKAQFDHRRLLARMPKEFLPFLQHLGTLSYEKEPNYELLFSLVNRALHRKGVGDDDPYDWELCSMEASVTQTSTQNAVVENHEEINHLHAQPSISPGEVAATSQNSPAPDRPGKAAPTTTQLQAALEHPMITINNIPQNTCQPKSLKKDNEECSGHIGSQNKHNGHFKEERTTANGHVNIADGEEVNTSRRELTEEGANSVKIRSHLPQENRFCSQASQDVKSNVRNGYLNEEKKRDKVSSNAAHEYSSLFCSDSSSLTSLSLIAERKGQHPSSSERHKNQKLEKGREVVEKMNGSLQWNATKQNTVVTDKERSRVASGSDNVFKDSESPLEMLSPWQLNRFPLPQTYVQRSDIKLDGPNSSAPIIPRPPPGHPTVKCVNARRRRFVRSSTGLPFSAGSTSSKL